MKSNFKLKFKEISCNSRNIFCVLIIMFFAILPSVTYSQFIQNTTQSLFSDVKAFKIGDALQVMITEDTQADNGATTQNSRTSDLKTGISFSAGTGGVGIDGAVGTGNTFSANGKTARSESIRSRLSAKVVNVEANGNLAIEGKRTTKVNGETQTIIIKGIVRPVDVQQNNSVYSYNIMDLTLLIDGDGTVTETQEPGFITKFLRILF